MDRPDEIRNHSAAGNGPAGDSSTPGPSALAVATREAVAILQANYNQQAQLLQARARGGFGMGAGQAADQKRACSAWFEYGFPVDVDFDMLYWLYRREGIAFGAVEKLIGRCWSDDPEVIEGDETDNKKEKTPWERENDAVLSAPWLWKGFAEADRRRLVGRYAGLILHVADGTPSKPSAWDQPVPRRSASYRLDKVTPAWANSLTVTEWDKDPNSSTYGEPLYWQYQEAASNGFAGVQRKIHRDRIFILGDYRGDAIGFLEPVFNAFVSLEKVTGGSGESFLKNAARQMAINYEKDIDFASIAKKHGIKPEALHAEIQKAARDLNMGNDTLLITQGASAITPMVTAVADPKPTFDVNLQTVSAGVDIPSKILVGNQTGERASTEDEAYMNKRCQGRRDRDMAPEVLDLTRHLMRIGVVTETQKMLTVMWGDLTLPTKTERLANAKLMSDINAASLGTDAPVFSRDEIREAAGYEKEDGAPVPLGEDVDDEGDDGDPQA